VSKVQTTFILTVKNLDNFQLHCWVSDCTCGYWSG